VNPAPLKKILIVDDDPAYLDMLGALMEQFRSGVWDVIKAADAGKAITVLREASVSLMLVDARMPVVDGFQLIRLVRQNYPHMWIVVLTGFADETTRSAYLNNGADLFLEKPRSPEGIQILFVALDDLLQRTPEYGFRGVMEQVELQDLLQIECSKRNSSRLEVLTRAERGEIFIKGGAVVHAQSGDLIGEPAFFHLLSLKGGELRVRPYLEPPGVTIQNSWISLLMEYAQRRDEVRPTLQHPELPQGTAAGLEANRADEPVAGLQASPLTEAERIPLPERIEEMLVVSAAGDVLYESGCRELLARKRWLDYLAQKAARLASLWPLGRLDRVEFDTRRGRCGAQTRADVGIFVIANAAPQVYAAPPQPPQP
jgi:DNA-binding response OmpR family regulator